MSAPILDATSFWGLLTARHESSPDHPLLLDEAGRSLTVAEVVPEVEQGAAGFHALGIGEGTPVTWVLPTRMETIISSFALSRLGAIQNPIIHIYRHREVGFCIKQTKAEFVLHPGRLGRVRLWRDGLGGDGRTRTAAGSHQRVRRTSDR